MVYNPNIPNAGDLLSNSQGQIKSNFSVANTAYGVNHFPFTDTTANAGKHIKVELPAGAIPISTIGEIVLFGGALPGGQSALFYQRDGSVNNFNLTGLDPVLAPTGSCTMVGNLIFNWGSISGTPIANNTVVTFNRAYSNAGNVFSIVLGPQSNTTDDKTISIKTGIFVI